MELYHVLNRGVDKRNIFLDNGDRVRFVHGLYTFNDIRSANNTTRHMNDLRSRSLERRPLVQIHGWCLMNNHYHLLLSEITEGGLISFIRKLNIGYAKFFNEKYKRSGTLFQGRTKKIRITTDAHFQYILHYIHLNPLDYLQGAADWRERRLKGAARALAHLEKYRWSSYKDYCGEHNFPSIITTALFKEVFGNYKKTLSSYLHDLEIESIKPLMLE